MAKEAKTVNFGLTNDVMNYLEAMTEKYGNKGDKQEKPGNETKIMICKIAEKETQKISNKLNELTEHEVGSEQWIKLMNALAKVREIVTYM